MLIQLQFFSSFFNFVPWLSFLSQQRSSVRQIAVSSHEVLSVMLLSFHCCFDVGEVISREIDPIPKGTTKKEG